MAPPILNQELQNTHVWIFPRVATAIVDSLSPEAFKDASAVTVSRKYFRSLRFGLEPAISVVRRKLFDVVAGRQLSWRHGYRRSLQIMTLSKTFSNTF